MKNLLDRWKLLPWRSLLQAAALTVLLMLILDILFNLTIRNLPVAATLLVAFFSPPLDIFLIFAIAVGVGALGVYCLEQLNRFSINANSLWALVLCLAVAFFVRSLLPLPGLIQLDRLQLIGMIIGVFWRGRPYWRSFQRW